MGFVSKSLKVLLCLFIFYVFLGLLDSGGIRVFGSSFYTLTGCLAFMSAMFFEISFSTHK